MTAVLSLAAFKWAGLALLILLPATLFLGTRFDHTGYGWCRSCLNRGWYATFKVNAGLFIVWCALFLVRGLAS